MRKFQGFELDVKFMHFELELFKFLVFCQPFFYTFNQMTDFVLFIRRDSDFDYSDDTIPENIYIYEVLKLYKRSLQYLYTFPQELYLQPLGRQESFCVEPSV